MKSLTTKYDPNVNSCDNSTYTFEVGKTREEQTAGVTSCFFSHGKDEQEEIYPPTITEISDAQRHDKHLSRYFKRGGASNTKTNRYNISLVEDTKVVTDNVKLVIPPCLQKDIVDWYHHYLQHPGSTRLEEMLRAAMT